MKKIIVGNWKMNGDSSFLKEFSKEFNGFDDLSEFVDLSFCLPMGLLGYSFNKDLISWKAHEFGGQDCHFENKGAFTGENSPALLKELGAEYVILGHSERRAYNGEASELLKKKLNGALRNELVPIFCIGETEEQRKDGSFKSVIVSQLDEVLDSDNFNEEIIIAYEPVWAIGTGLVPSKLQVEGVFEIIAHFLEQKFGEANNRILYGGSVNSESCLEFNDIDNLSGYLIGGASLKPAEFYKIVKSFI